MVDDSPPLIELTSIRRVFGAPGNETPSLRSVTLTVRRGEFVAIVGPSGAGKSTLLNILGLLDRASSGTYLLAGVDVAGLAERERDRIRNELLGFVFQDSHMLIDETAAANAALPLKVRGIDLTERSRLAGSALSRLGLSHRVNERALNLSGGERQRAAMARAIAGGPALILADEPTGALDSTNSRLIVEYLHELNASGVTVIVITHDESIAASAGRRLSLVDGVLEEEPPSPASTSVDTNRSSRTEDVDHSKRAGSWSRRVGEEFLDALDGHAASPGRALLLLLAFALAIAGLVAAIGINQSASAQIAERLTQASLDQVTVRSDDPESYRRGFYFSNPSGVERDSRPAQLIRDLPGVVDTGFVGTMLNGSARVGLLPQEVGAQTFSGPVLIADAGYLRVLGATVRPASAGALLDNGWRGRVALLGNGAARVLGIASIGPGSQIWVAGQSVDVVGLIDDHGRDERLKDAVVLSPAAAGVVQPEDVRLVVRTEPGYPAAVADAIPLAVSPGDPTAIRLDTVADLRNLRVGVASDLGVLVGVVSILLLLLACLTSAVAMYLSVRVRAKEIALRRAVGASRAAIQRQFTIEGLSIGLAGGVTGGAAGLCAVVAVAILNRWTPTIDLRVFAVGVVAGVVSGVLSAAYPAFVASRIDPALAIRG